MTEGSGRILPQVKSRVQASGKPEWADRLPTPRHTPAFSFPPSTLH
jgi:hypothetical protein